MSKRFRIAQRAGRFMLVVVICLAGQVLWAAPSAEAGTPSYTLDIAVKGTGRYPQTVFSEVTNEGKFAKIFPIKGAKNNLGKVGTFQPLHKNINPFRKGDEPFPVHVSKLSATSWTFQTEPGHIDYPGTISFTLYKNGDTMRLKIHGVCKLCGNPGYWMVANATWYPFVVHIRQNVHF